jgi:DNA-binding NtrC family response regulator
MKTYKIDIIEDSSIVAQLLKHELEKEPSYSVEVFSNGEDYLLKPRSADLIILDYFLDSDEKEAMNGLAVLKAIRNLKNQVPVVFFSGQNKLRVVIKALKRGATDYVSKDAENFIDDIVSSVKQIKERRNSAKSRLAWKKALKTGLLSALLALLAGICFYMLF